jgi:catechol 2,3-dioxygenase-like lactoylglutathione lyase family enzyme
MVDCRDPEPLVAFWGEVLGLEEKGRFPGYVWMGRMGEDGPSLAFQVVPEPKQVKNRLHFDLAVDDREAFISLAVSLGAKRIADHEIEGFHWTVMADPEGNEFCVAEH